MGNEKHNCPHNENKGICHTCYREGFESARKAALAEIDADIQFHKEQSRKNIVSLKKDRPLHNKEIINHASILGARKAALENIRKRIEGMK